MRILSPCSLMVLRPGMLPRWIGGLGLASRSFSGGPSLWPPASILTSSLVDRRSMASRRDRGEWYSKDAGIMGNLFRISNFEFRISSLGVLDEPPYRFRCEGKLPDVSPQGAQGIFYRAGYGCGRGDRRAFAGRFLPQGREG